MRIWLALIAAPGLALACQGVMYALVAPACSMHTRFAIHAVAALSLLLCVVFALLARSVRAPQTRHFLAIVATAVGALSALVVLSMWFAVWILSPCFS